MKALFVTATAQTEANYYLIWHLFKANNTDITHIVILSTEFTRKKDYVKNLTKVLSLPDFALDENISIEGLHLPDGIEETSVNAIKVIIMQWLTTHQPSQVIFNITGGTKLISIAQDQIASTSSRYYCVYQSRANNQLIWYNNPPNRQRYDMAIPESITARLIARGYEQVSAESSLLNLPAEQFYYIDQFDKFITQDLNKAQSLALLINALSAEALNNRQETKFPYIKAIEPNGLYHKCKDWLMVLAQIEQPYFSFEPENNEMLFYSKDAVEFMGGKWFEVWVGYQISRHYFTENDPIKVQVGLEFKRNSDGNEADIAYISNGYFNLMECKTVNWRNKERATTLVNEKLHKLASVAQVAGLNSYTYFISLYDIPEQSKKVAQDLGIQLIADKNLLKLAEFLKDND